jgi:uncharacterized caspase-like protein
MPTASRLPHSDLLLPQRVSALPLLVLLVFAFTLSFGPPGSMSADKPLGSAPKSEAAQEEEITAVPTLAHGSLYALVVGVSAYQNAAVPPLRVAAQDARDVAEYLKTQKELFRRINVSLLLNEQATKAAVEKYLFYELRNAGKDDTIFIFLSGHGAADPKQAGQYYFMGYDADPDLLHVTALNMSGLAFLKRLDCPRVILVADACHAGGFSKWRMKAVVPMKTFLQDFAASSGRVVITSSRPEEYSLETPLMPNSVFTHYLLQGLRGAADANGDKVVTINEAYSYVYERTKAETEGAQHPQFEGALEGVLPLALVPELGARPQTSLELQVDPPGAEVFVGGRLVGRTNPDGSIYLKYLPLERPIGVKVRKEGWLTASLGPFSFSSGRMSHKADPVRLQPAVGSLEMKISPGKARVSIDGKEVGRTRDDGRLLVHGVQVAVPHVVELRRDGYEDESIILTIPAEYEGKKFRADEINLSKKRAEPSASQRAPEYRERPAEAPSGPSATREERRSPAESSPTGSGGSALREERTGF